jgi:hypothetical protein
MSALGQKQTSRPEISMSALPPKADITERDPYVRCVPKADIGGRSPMSAPAIRAFQFLTASISQALRKGTGWQS